MLPAPQAITVTMICRRCPVLIQAVSSGDDIGQQLIFAPGDLVAKPELAFLQPRELQLVGCSSFGERDDRGIKVAMLDAKQFQALGNFLGAHMTSLPRSPLVRNGDRPTESPRHRGCFVIYFALPIESKRRMPMSTSHLSTLKSRHADLDVKIANEERRPAPDTGVLAQLKKQKLKLKEEMLAIG